MGAIYKAPPLLVSTILTSEESQGQMRKGRGQRLEKDGNCKLVGVATIDPIDDIFMNSFLGLPTECLAFLNATILLWISYMNNLFWWMYNLLDLNFFYTWKYIYKFKLRALINPVWEDYSIVAIQILQSSLSHYFHHAHIINGLLNNVLKFPNTS